MPAGSKQYVDLHIHTKFSDGSLTVREVVEIAVRRQLQAISITDHDSIEAYPEAKRVGELFGIEVIPGVELSSEIQGNDIHVLGYFIDTTSPLLVARLREMREARYVRARKIVENLNRQGVDLRFETVLHIAGKAAIGRPHIAAAMLKEELVSSFREAFDKYLGYESPAYVEKMTLSPKEVFDLIRSAGGVAVLAHPGVTNIDDRIVGFVAEGLEGIEVYHPEHASSAVNRYILMCAHYELVRTGGSDFHSALHNRSEIGIPLVSSAVLGPLRARAERRRC